MADYKKMYAVLCGAIDGMIDELERSPLTLSMAKRLNTALLEAEKIYVDTSAYFEENDGAEIIELKIDRQSDCE